MSHDIVITKDSSYGDSLAEKFLSLKESNTFTDCKVIILDGDEEVCKLKVHANITSAFSLYFNKMWGSEMHEGINRICNSGGFEPDLMKKMIDYIYTGSITIAVSDFNQAKQLCEYWQIPRFEEVFRQEFQATMTVDNALRRLMAAQQHRIIELVPLSQDFITSWFTEVTSSSEFVQLEVKNLQQFLQDCPAMHISTDDKLMAVVRWIKHDIRSRCSNEMVISLFKNCLPFCSKKLLISLNQSNLSDFLMLTKLDVCVADALRNKDLSNAQKMISDRYSIVLYDTLGGKCLKLEENRLTEFHTLEGFKEYSVCQCYGVGLIFSGGRRRACKLFNLLTKHWSPLANLETGLTGHASVCMMGELFIIGGQSYRGSYIGCWQSTAECLIVDVPNSKWKQVDVPNSKWKQVDVQNSKWKQLPDVPLEVLFRPQIAHVDHNIYVAGHSINRFVKFDVRGREWSELDTICEDVGIALTLEAGGGNIYAVGNTVAAMYSIATDRWTKIRQPSNQQDLQYSASVFHDNKLFILGGLADQVQEYNIKNDKWGNASINLERWPLFVKAFSMTYSTETGMSPKDDADPQPVSSKCVLS